MRGTRWRTASIALLALLVAGQAWPITIRPQRESNPENPGNSPNEIVAPETPDERIADWTEALAKFTAVLVIVSATQIWFLIRADKTARITADAAKQSADVAERALEQTSAPYLDIAVSLKDANIHKLIGGEIRIDLMGRDFAQYIIRNHGRSPAIILETYHYCWRFPGLPSEIAFPPPQTNLYKTSVVGGTKESEPFPIGYPSEGIDNLFDGYPIWVQIQIRYRDVFMNQYISTYCGSLNPQRAAFVAYGARKYNDRRKLTDEDLKIAESRDS